MSDETKVNVEDVPATHAADGQVETEDKPDYSNIGVCTPFDYSPEPFAELSEDAKGALLELDNITDKQDVAARRLEVEQAWEALHFDRGYQHLYHNNKGGWVLPGQSLGNGRRAPDYQATHVTNIYSSEGDIITAGLTIAPPELQFYPNDPEYGPDQYTAEEANKFKDIWSINNDLQDLIGQCARIFWNEDRLLFYTRYVLDGQKYGFESEEDAPLVPEDLEDQPSDEPTGQEDQTIENLLNDSPEGEEQEETVQPEKKQRKPRGREVTSVYGKLDHKVPIGVDSIREMHFVKLFRDLDVAVVRGMLPWIEDQIQPGSDGTSEVELDRIARENVRQAVLGAYVTGDSMNRHVVLKYSWFRPNLFYDKCVTEAVREELLEKFPDGCLLVKAGSTYAFSRNECVDDHLDVRHALKGKGQNRRALGTSMIPLQKRINTWIDLLDSFFRRTVAKKWYNSEAFDLQAVKNSTNTPGASGPFSPQPGLTTADQYIMVEPTPQPQPALPAFVQYFTGDLAEKITGAVPAIFGGAEITETLGGIQIQREQALQRLNNAWNELRFGLANAARQAVCCAAACRKEDERITQVVPGKGKVVVDCSRMKGNINCHPGFDGALPESAVQRQQKILMLVDGAKGNPKLQDVLLAPENLPAVNDALRLKGIYIPGADSVKKQENEFELLLRKGPQDNPQYLKAQEVLQQAQQGLQQAQASSQQLPPDAAAKVQQLEQLVSSVPQKICSVPVAQDETENHIIEASTCVKWMNSTEGQKFKWGTDEQKAAYENVHLHWQGHSEMAKKIAAQNAPPQGKGPSESVTANLKDLPNPVKTQILQSMGIKVDESVFEAHEKEQLNKKIAEKSIPEAINVQRNQPQETVAA